MTMTNNLTAFGVVAELRAKISALECAGRELARSEDLWKARALTAEHERDELSSQAIARELAEDEERTQVDQSSEVRRLCRECTKLERELLAYQDALATALGSWQGPMLDAAIDAIRQSKKRGAWPRRYMP